MRLNPENAKAYHNLGYLLEKKGADGEALAAYRQALKSTLDPVPEHYRIGVVLMKQGQLDAAASAFREAIKVKTDDLHSHFQLGRALALQGQTEAAADEWRTTVRLDPNHVEAHYNLGRALGILRQWDQAIAEYEQALRLRPNFAEAHCNLADHYRRQGRYTESLASYRRGHELGSKRPDWAYPSAQWVETAERMVALGPRLPAILAGTEDPADPADATAAAVVAAQSEHYARAAELYRAALTKPATPADDGKSDRRYAAACAAARTGCGQGADTAKLDAAARGVWRRQALEWLRAELTVRKKQLADGTPAKREVALDKVRRWQADSDLAGVRDDAALAKLPNSERVEWAQLWADVRDMLAKPKGQPQGGSGERGRL